MPPMGTLRPVAVPGSGGLWQRPLQRRRQHLQCLDPWALGEALGEAMEKWWLEPLEPCHQRRGDVRIYPERPDMDLWYNWHPIMWQVYCGY